MEFIDHYQTLGVSKKSTQDEIKKAYRKLARTHHPDVNPNDSEAKLKFQQINEANNVLSDPEQRKKYDEYGRDWEHADAFEKAKRNRSTTQNNSRTNQSEEDYSDFFASMFGSASGRGRGVKYKGEDFQTTFNLSLLDAYTTHKQTIKINGKSLRITIPAGVTNGQTIKLLGHGGAGLNGGPGGDLYITFSIPKHAKFNRKNNDLYATAELDLYTAVLGGEHIFETLNGKVKLKIAPETQNGKQVKLKGKGFPIYKKEGAYGDLYITYNIKTPNNLTPKQKELFTELSKLADV